MVGRSDRFVLCISTLLLSMSILAPCTVCQLAPAVKTDRAVYPYNIKEVLLSGSGLTANRYFVWLVTPGENQSKFTGESFIVTSIGNIPYPTVWVAFNRKVLGTYIVTLSTSESVDTRSARCSFGLFGPEKSVYERRETIHVTGGGASPGSTVRIDIRTPADMLAYNATAVADQRGEFHHTWYLENNVPIGSWSLSAVGTDTFDATAERWHVDVQFGVKAASLRMTVYGQPASVYQRTQRATVALMIKYPDGSPVVTARKGSQPVMVAREGTTLKSLPLVLTDPLNGVWLAEYYTARNESLLTNYTFVVSAAAFDDGHGNTAPSATLQSASFKVVSAQLLVSTTLSKRSYEILFDQIILNATITYPDGTRMTAGTIVAHIESSGGNETLAVNYDPQTRDWRLTRQLSFFDIPLVGHWSINLTATDNLGNTGTVDVEFDVSPLWLVVSVIALFVICIVLAKWVSEEKTLVSRIRRRSTQPET